MRHGEALADAMRAGEEGIGAGRGGEKESNGRGGRFGIQCPLTGVVEMSKDDDDQRNSRCCKEKQGGMGSQQEVEDEQGERSG